MTSLPIETLPRCDATIIVHDRSYRCLGDLGHDSPHWCSPVIWTSP